MNKYISELSLNYILNKPYSYIDALHIQATIICGHYYFIYYIYILLYSFFFKNVNNIFIEFFYITKQANDSTVKIRFRKKLSTKHRFLN